MNSERTVWLVVTKTMIIHQYGDEPNLAVTRVLATDKEIKEHLLDYVKFNDGYCSANDVGRISVPKSIDDIKISPNGGYVARAWYDGYEPFIYWAEKLDSIAYIDKAKEACA